MQLNGIKWSLTIRGYFLATRRMKLTLTFSTFLSELESNKGDSLLILVFSLAAWTIWYSPSLLASFFSVRALFERARKNAYLVKGVTFAHPFSCWNKASVCKLLWNLANKKDKVWVRWIHEYYIKGRDITQMEAGVHFGHGTRKMES